MVVCDSYDDDQGTKDQGLLDVQGDARREEVAARGKTGAKRSPEQPEQKLIEGISMLAPAFLYTIGEV